jgi:hypothetical protein
LEEMLRQSRRVASVGQGSFDSIIGTWTIFEIGMLEKFIGKKCPEVDKHRQGRESVPISG